MLVLFSMQSCKSVFLRPKLFELIFTESEQEFQKYYNHKVAKHPSNVHRGRLKTFTTGQDYSNRRISNNTESNVT